MRKQWNRKSSLQFLNWMKGFISGGVVIHATGLVWVFCLVIFGASHLSKSVCWAAPIADTSLAVPIGTPTAASVDGLSDAAQKLAERGDFAGAITQWKIVATQTTVVGDKTRQVWALAHIGEAYMALGQNDAAETSLNAALTLMSPNNAIAVGLDNKARSIWGKDNDDCLRQGTPALELSNRDCQQSESQNLELDNRNLLPQQQKLLFFIQNTLGSLYTQLQQPRCAQWHLDEAQELAGTDPYFQAQVQNNLGNLCVLRKQNLAACKAYKMSEKLADNNTALRTQAASNLLLRLSRMAKEKQSFEGRNAALEAAKLWPTVRQAVQSLSPSYDVAQRLLSLGFTAQLLSQQEDPPAYSQAKEGWLAYWLSNAEQADLAALSVAQGISNARSMSLALGYLGKIAEIRGQVDKAFQYTRHARFLAQQFPFLLYQWEWQIARLYDGRQNGDEAIAACRRAVDALETVSDCTGPRNGNIYGSFREEVAPIYGLLADLLLRRAAASLGTTSSDLIQARYYIELSKAAEISDYYRDDCIIGGLNRIKDVEKIIQDKKYLNKNFEDTAVIYYIALSDRLEILVSLPSGLKQFQAPAQHKNDIRSAALLSDAQSFRRLLENSSDSNDPDLRQMEENLYQQLITPIEAILREHKIKTLVFVPDAVLRAIPMAALYDGDDEKFLIQKYAIAIEPSFTLMDPQPLTRPDLWKPNHIFAGGISKAVRGYDELKGAERELLWLQHTFGVKPLMNEGFTKKAVLCQIINGQYSIVHLASHSIFGDSNRPEQTYFVTYDSQLTLDDIESAIRPHLFQGQPVELLVLSGCQTGDSPDPFDSTDRAAMGLAGVALKSGARSVLASLWPVYDDSTDTLMERFYAELTASPQRSKAEALQKAQIALIKSPPKRWAPYLIIGNWL